MGTLSKSHTSWTDDCHLAWQGAQEATFLRRVTDRLAEFEDTLHAAPPTSLCALVQKRYVLVEKRGRMKFVPSARQV